MIACGTSRSRLWAFLALCFLWLPSDTVLADPGEIIERATAIHQEALAAEHGWSVTVPLIAEARAAIAAGDERAQALAERALLFAERSLVQAEQEKQAWHARVPGN